MLKSSYIAQNPVILWLETSQYLFWESLEISNTTRIEVTYICYRYSTFPLRCLRRNRSLQSCRTFSSTPCQVHRMDLQNTGCSRPGQMATSQGDQATQNSIQILQQMWVSRSQTWESTGDSHMICWCFLIEERNSIFFAEWHRKIEWMFSKNRGDVCEN